MGAVTVGVAGGTNFFGFVHFPARCFVASREESGAYEFFVACCGWKVASRYASSFPFGRDRFKTLIGEATVLWPDSSVDYADYKFGSEVGFGKEAEL